YNTKVTVDGYSANGVTKGGGCCVINCNNDDEIYAFHTSGANVLKGDGSVQFLADGTAPGVVAAVISRAGGDPLHRPRRGGPLPRRGRPAARPPGRTGCKPVRRTRTGCKPVLPGRGGRVATSPATHALAARGRGDRLPPDELPPARQDLRHHQRGG